MTDLDPEIWNNPTLGAAATNGFADEDELQAVENLAAKREGREPMVIRRLHRYPGEEKVVQLESSYDNGMRFLAPGTPLDIPLAEALVYEETPVKSTRTNSTKK